MTVLKKECFCRQCYLFMFQNALQTAWYARGDGKVIPNFQLVRVIVEEKKNKMGGKESVHRERRVIF